MPASTVNSTEFIQKTFSPFVAVIASPLVNEVCQKNNLSFVELLEPFCVLQKEVTYKDPLNNTITVKNPRIQLSDINAKPPDPAVARKLLNDSVSRFAENNVELVKMKSGNLTVEIPAMTPWFERWRETFLQVQYPSDHEFTKHYLACMIVTSTKEENPMDELSNLGQQLQQMLGTPPPKTMPKWFSSSVLRYYILLHDSSSDSSKKTESVFEEMKSTYNAQHCYLLKINSGKCDETLFDYWPSRYHVKFDSQEMSTSLNLGSFMEPNFDKVETAVEMHENSKMEMVHPLSPQSENNDDMLDEMSNSFNEQKGALLSVDDIENLKVLLSNFIISSLIPFVETQMQYLNDMVSNKKGVSKSIFGATRRWFSGPKPGSPTSVPNAHYYHPDSPELQMRRLGDLCFMFCAYQCAFQAYHTAKRDFNSDGAWLCYAGALEMAALTCFLMGTDTKKAQEYTEESIVTYLQTCRMPQFATRLTLCAAECLRSNRMYGEAAGRLLQMTSEESDLRSALLLEQAAYCFVHTRMPRKYAFHLVLAGHRYVKAGQRKHSLRCYRMAYQVYQNRNWSLAEDHIHYTIGKLSSGLKQLGTTVAEYSCLFAKPSTQLPAQQAVFLKEYFLALIEFQKQNGITLPKLQVPHIDQSSIEVALNVCVKNEVTEDGFVLASRPSSDDELDERWWKLEEQFVTSVNKSIIFKPTNCVFSNHTNNSTKPVCVVNEYIRVSVNIVNILNIPLNLKKIQLMWGHSSQTNSENGSQDKDIFADAEIIESLSLDPNSNTKISLHITPKIAGELHVGGLAYTMVLQIDGHSELSGYAEFAPRGARIVSKKVQNPTNTYLPDYRLQLQVVDDAPSLKVYMKNVPAEMLCGEVREVSIRLWNSGTLPIDRLMFTASEPRLFCVDEDGRTLPTGDRKQPNVYQLPLSHGVPAGHDEEVKVYLRAPEVSGRTAIDLLFYYDSVHSSQSKFKYRLVYHTVHFMLHESVYACVNSSRSAISEDDEVVNIRVKVENRNQDFDPVAVSVHLLQFSLYSQNWMLYDIVQFSPEDLLLEQEVSAMYVLKAKRIENNNYQYTDLNLTEAENVSVKAKPYSNFANLVVNRLLVADDEPLDKQPYLCGLESALTLNSVLIVLWKAEMKTESGTSWTTGQHHVPLCKLGVKSESVVEVPSLAADDPVTSIADVDSVTKHLLLIGMNHATFIKHSFLEERICVVSVEISIRNCCDHAIEVKLDASYQTINQLLKSGSESVRLLWLGPVLQIFVLEKRTEKKVRLSVTAGNAGTYDLGAHFTVLARKYNTSEIFIQQSVPRSLLSISNTTIL